MRLHSLTLQAFGPFPTRQSVDFDELASSGLFLLEGPTGAGKTTVLDALTFALYGELSGEQSNRDRLHSDFADPATTPEVTVEWSVRGRRMRITRVPEHERPRKRGTGTTREAARVHLEELADGGWITRSANKAETGEIVTDLMGLNRAQFTQVVLLPQGEFARFLRADDDDRRALLTKLFGTHLYDRITAELDARRYDAERARSAARHHIEQALAAAGQAAGLDAEQRQALVALDAADLDTTLAALATDVATADQQAQVAAALALDTLTTADQVRETTRAHAERVRRVVAAQDQCAAHEQGRSAHEQRAATLARGTRAEPVRPLLAALADAEQVLAGALVELSRQVPDTTPAMRRGEGAGAIADAAEQAGQCAARLTHVVALEADLPAGRAALAGAEAARGDAQERVRALTAALAQLPDRIATLESDLAGARAAAAPLQSARDRLPEALARRDAARERVDLDPTIAAAHARWQRAVADRQDSQREHEHLTTVRLQGMSAELAAELAPGMPCGVCGSLDHPAPAFTGEAAVTAVDVERARDARDAAVERCHREEDTLHALTARRDVLSGTIGTADLPALQHQLEALEQSVRAATEATTRVDALAGELSERRTHLASAGQQLTEATIDCTSATERAAAARQLVEAAAATIASECAEHPTVAARREALIRLAADQRAIAACLHSVVAARAGRDQAADRAEAEAVTRGFTGVEPARAAALDPQRRAQLTQQVTDWEQERAARQAALADPDLAGIDPADAAGAHTRLEQAKDVWDRAEHAHDRAAKELDAATRTARAWAECLTDLRRAKDAHVRTREQTAAVIGLAALAKGTDGHRKVALTTYVLRHWFAQVVAAANLRLAAMSAGRYELERSDEAESRVKRAGLTLTVVDRYTGDRRHPTSLSGGETFFTSLALALGLAEVVTGEAGGVALDTLFIDEGFGSLDSTTLDQVMEVIDELRDHGRVVGIVSHVADLKDRVPERLEVRRVADGSSVLRVVA